MAEPYKHIYKVDLNQPLKRFDVGDILATGDDKANSFEVAVCRDGANVDLSGCAVYGYFIRPNDETMKVDGTAEGSLAKVELTKSCYVYDGAFSFAIKVVGNGITQTVAVFDGRIVKTTTENIVDGNRVIYGLEELLAQIAAMEAAEKAANDAAESANTAAGNANTAAENANKWANAETSAVAISASSQPTVDVTEEDGKKVLTFGIPAGQTPNITFRVATGEPGTQVLVQQSGTPEAPVVDLTIPRGDTGAVEGLDYYAGSPSALGTASPGTANGVARGDHVHPMPTAEQVGARENTWMPTASDVGALAADGTAADASKLGGVDASEYALKSDVPSGGGTATDVENLGGKPPEYYIQPVELLDNGAFEIAQAGYCGSHGNDVYAADRWLVSWGSSEISVERSDGVTTITSSATSLAKIVQHLSDEAMRYLEHGTTLTLAVCKADGTIKTTSFTYEEPSVTNNTLDITAIDETWSINLYQGTSDDRARVRIYSGAPNTLSFRWVRLVVGAYTSDTLPPYVQKGYAEELVECMRYYQQYGGNFFAELASESGRCLGSLVLPVEMRCAPTTNYVANSKVNCDIYGVGTQETTVSHANTSTKTVYFSFKNDNAGYKYITTQDTITLSADL